MRLIFDGTSYVLANKIDMERISTALSRASEVKFDLSFGTGLLLNGRPGQVQMGSVHCEIDDDVTFSQPERRDFIGLGCVSADQEAWSNFSRALSGPEELNTDSKIVRSDVSRYKDFAEAFKEIIWQKTVELNNYGSSVKGLAQGEAAFSCSSRTKVHLHDLNATELWVWINVLRPYDQVTPAFGVDRPPNLAARDFIIYRMSLDDIWTSQKSTYAEPFFNMTALEPASAGTVSMKAPLLQGMTVSFYILILLGGTTLSVYGEFEDGRKIYKALGGPITALILVVFTILIKKIFPLWTFEDALAFKLKIDSLSDLPPNRSWVLQKVMPTRLYHTWLNCLLELMNSGHILASGPYACWGIRKSPIGGFKLDLRVPLLDLVSAGMQFNYQLEVIPNGELYLRSLNASFLNYNFGGEIISSLSQVHLHEAPYEVEGPAAVYTTTISTLYIKIIDDYVGNVFNNRISLVHLATVGGG